MLVQPRRGCPRRRAAAPSSRRPADTVLDVEHRGLPRDQPGLGPVQLPILQGDAQAREVAQLPFEKHLVAQGARRDLQPVAAIRLARAVPQRLPGPHAGEVEEHRAQRLVVLDLRGTQAQHAPVELEGVGGDLLDARRAFGQEQPGLLQRSQLPLDEIGQPARLGGAHDPTLRVIVRPCRRRGRRKCRIPLHQRLGVRAEELLGHGLVVAPARLAHAAPALGHDQTQLEPLALIGRQRDDQALERGALGRRGAVAGAADGLTQLFFPESGGLPRPRALRVVAGHRKDHARLARRDHAGHHRAPQQRAVGQPAREPQTVLDRAPLSAEVLAHVVDVARRSELQQAAALEQPPQRLAQRQLERAGAAQDADRLRVERAGALPIVAGGLPVRRRTCAGSFPFAHGLTDNG